MFRRSPVPGRVSPVRVTGGVRRGGVSYVASIRLFVRDAMALACDGKRLVLSNEENSLDRTMEKETEHMRSKIIGFVVGCGLAAATIVPAVACSYHTQASSDQNKPEQTAQAQGSTNTSTQ